VTPSPPARDLAAHLRWDLLGLVWLAASMGLWASLLTHDPADPWSEASPWLMRLLDHEVAYPLNSQVANWCGWWGAVISSALLQGLGLGAYLVAGLSCLAALVCFRHRPLASPLSRSVGWTLVLVSLTTLPPLLDWHPPLSVPIGAGGYLGWMCSSWLRTHFAAAGGFILVFSGLIAGLLLSTEYVVLRAIGWLAVGPAVLTVQACRRHWGRGCQPSGGRRVDDISITDLPASIRSEISGEGAEAVAIRLYRPGRGGGSEGESKPPGWARVWEAARAWVSGLVGVRRKWGASTSVRPDSSGSEATVSTPSGLAGPLISLAGEPTVAVEPVRGERARASAGASGSTSGSEPTGAGLVGTEAEADGTRELDGGDSKSGPGIKFRSKPQRASDAAPALEEMDDTQLPSGTEEYVLPGVDLLEEGEDFCYEEQEAEVRRKAKMIEQTFSDFGLNVRVVEIETGPVIAQYEIELEAGLRLSKVTGLADDLAIALRVPSVRIVAPIPGKNTVGIEVPNEVRQVVRLREVIEESGDKLQKMKVPLFLGKDVSGNPLVVDLASMPHLLIAGRTGTGKSVCLNTIISSMLMTRRPDEVRMLMIDPKMVELSGYGRLPHLMHPVVTDMRKAEAILAWAVDKMEERYALLARAGVRHITSYNQLGREELLDRCRLEDPDEAELIPDHLPFIVIVADEMADLMMTAGKDAEQHIIRLAQKSRAVGIHLVLATQKPTVDVITGLIKSNLPARLAFQVASRTDSRVVLDENGADKLLGNGDMLLLWPGTSTLLRGQGTYLSDEEINRLVDHCSTGEQDFVKELVNLKVRSQDGEEEPSAGPAQFKRRDDLYEAAIEVVIREGRGSCSLLQRALGIGYGRAARLIDFMAEDGIVGQYNGSQAREVIITMSDWEAMRGGEGSDTTAAAGAPAATRRGRIQRDHGWDGDEVSVAESGVAPLAYESEEDEDVAAMFPAKAMSDDDQPHPDDPLPWEHDR
jgi:DNA segregation ATPase FtsK/SpoIIIE, S-DNA-T family